MKNAVKSVAEMWVSIFFNYLIEDDLISYYTFFTLIFAECAYLFASKPLKLAIPFTILLCLHMVNVIYCGYQKFMFEGTKKEPVIIIVYIAIFVVLVLIGFIFSIPLSLVLIAIPLVITYLWVKIRSFQDTRGWDNKLIDRLFENRVFYWVSQIIVIGLPFATLIVCFAAIPKVPLALKIIVPIIYLLIIPFFSWLEDTIVAENIFEIAFHKEYNGKESEEITQHNSDNID